MSAKMNDFIKFEKCYIRVSAINHISDIQSDTTYLASGPVKKYYYNVMIGNKTVSFVFPTKESADKSINELIDLIKDEEDIW